MCLAALAALSKLVVPVLRLAVLVALLLNPLMSHKQPMHASEGCCCDGYDGQSTDSCNALEEEVTTPKCVAIPANEMNLDDDFCNDQYEATVAVGQAPNDIMMACCSCDGYTSTESCGALVARAKLRAFPPHFLRTAKEETGGS